MDVAWVSNFFEHLRDSDELLSTLRELRRVLRPGGRLLVLQPNIRLTGPGVGTSSIAPCLSPRSVSWKPLVLAGFSVESMKVRFLPYTTESRLPVWPMLIRLYLRFPPAQFLLGKQTFVVARST